jgi:hypothetical protein
VTKISDGFAEKQRKKNTNLPFYLQFKRIYFTGMVVAAAGETPQGQNSRDAETQHTCVSV